MSDSSDVSGPSGSAPAFVRKGLYKLPFLMPDGSRPCVAVNRDGVLAGTYFMPANGDEGRARRILSMMVDHNGDGRRHLEPV